ncbi:MAG: hypothetical protein WCW26_00285 [Candidatus Buchananbacteria bacterium]
MKKLLKILNWFFVALGIIFLILIIIVAYLFMADPFKLKPVLKTWFEPAAVTNNATTTDKNPLLTVEQEKTLESLGVNPAALPTAITPKMEKCFTEKLGQARVAEIIKTGQPTAADFFAARACLNN